MRNGRVTSLKDVASAAGVSVATVSRMLNGTLDLPDETKKRIQDVIQDLNYQPNPHARRLSLGRAETIGLVVPDIANPFFATLVAAVEEEADRRGLSVALSATLNRPGREIAYLQSIARNHIDGLIFLTNHPDDGQLAELINKTDRVVLVDEDVPGAKAPKLFGDNETGGYLAGHHLAEHEHRSTLFIGGPEEMVSTRRRFSGLARAMHEAFGSAAHLKSYKGDFTVSFGRQAAQRFIAEKCPATAIFASSDEIAVGLMEVFQAEGIRVPDDVSIVGFDDVGPLHLFAPPLTAIRQPVRALGQRALSMLLETNWQEREPHATEEVLPVEIVVRKSVAPPSKQ